jgi:hypothetical protein
MNSPAHFERTRPRQGDAAKLKLEVLLALDRMLVEVSMQLYNIDPRDRSKMRRQNCRLHAAVREHIPQRFRR